MSGVPHLVVQQGAPTLGSKLIQMPGHKCKASWGLADTLVWVLDFLSMWD